MKIILFFVAVMLVIPLSVFSLLFSVVGLPIVYGLRNGLKEIEYLFLRMAISLDQFGNVICALPFAVFFLDKSKIIMAHPFGSEDETVSYVLAVNQKRETLNKFGLFMCKVLDFLDKDHMKKAIITQREQDKKAVERYKENEFHL